MNTEVKQQWVEALRSGQYEQGTGRLHRAENGVSLFCCLGVLCDLAVKAGATRVGPVVKYDVDDKTPIYTDLYYGDEHAAGLGTITSFEVLPDNVREWAGLDIHDPVLIYEDDSMTSMSSLNDNIGASFGEIADLIEEQL